jgi:GTP-binding protein
VENFSKASTLTGSVLRATMKITSAVFNASATDLSSCLDEALPEFAFIGRSNVGKSTLLNTLAGKRDLARVSDKPGFTKMINFFTINHKWRLVDLPGYGFAKVAKSDRAKFSQLIEAYLLSRKNLACVFVLIDSSIKPLAIDLDFVHWIGNAGKPFALVFTKTDKVKAGKASENIELFMGAIASWFVEPPEIFTTSCKTKEGVRELLGVIASCVA